MKSGVRKPLSDYFERKKRGPENLSSRNHFAHFGFGCTGFSGPFGGTWFQSLFGGTDTGTRTGTGAHWFYFYIITALLLLPAPGGQENNRFYGLIDANLETRKNLLRLFVWNLVAQKLPQSSKVHTGWIQRWPYFSPL